MIRLSTGNMFDAPVEALVNTVNLVGVMGKGVALQFKERFMENFELYKEACLHHTIGIGNSLVVDAVWNGRNIKIINFPTKIHWRNPSELRYVEQGLDNLIDLIAKHNIRSIAIPPLGAGNGGLDWQIVKPLILEKLGHLDCDILLYEPGHKAVSAKRKVNLTTARAMLIYMLDQLQQRGIDATEFAAVKLIYFMQKFGAQPIFKLNFVQYSYGPYCQAVAHVLHGIDGAYIIGFADMNKKPFEPFGLIKERLPEVRLYVEGDAMSMDTILKTCEFLEDRWDEFNMELLSSVDMLMHDNPEADQEEIYQKLCNWSARKRRLFENRNLVFTAFNHVVQNSAY